MKLTGEQLLILGDAGVLAELGAQKLAPLAAYRIARVTAVVLPEVMRILVARNAMLTPENSTEISPGVWQLRPAFAADFTAAVDPLLKETVDLAVKPLTLGDLDGATITPRSIQALGPLLEEPKEA